MEPRKPTLAIYVKTWLSLLGLLVATLLVAQFKLGIFGLPIALLIALAQALLILLFFMHLHYSKAEMVVVACAAYLWLGILLVGTMHDYLSRDWLPLPGSETPQRQRGLR